MTTVGIRELKNRLSHYVREVRGGETVLVTDRGEVVAELRPPAAEGESPSPSSGLAELARRGILKPGEPKRPGLYPRLQPLLSGTTAAELLDQERGEH